jgi:hypothetical protein
MFRSHSQGADFANVPQYFEFFPAINIEHRVERNNAFIALVFGYSILTILYQSHASFGINAFFGKGILGLLQAFAFNWIYFEIDNYLVHVHAIRRHWFSASLWSSVHIPFIMSYILAAATLSQLVLAHDCADADEHDLGSHYEERSLPELSDAIRWYYCGGLGVALFSMGVISLCHVHKKLTNPRLRKRPRLAIRAVVSAIIIVLPTAKSLNSMHLIAITFSLILFILLLDLYGNSAQGSSFWTGGCCQHEKRKTSYVAAHKIGRKKRADIQRALERGEKVGLADLLKRHGSTSSMSSGSGSNTPKVSLEPGSHVSRCVNGLTNNGAG